MSSCRQLNLVIVEQTTATAFGAEMAVTGAEVGAEIGTAIAPGIGTVIAGAVGFL